MGHEGWEGALPPLYAAWIGEILDPVPAERSATCDACAMAACEGCGGLPDGFFFDPATKCCTYLPSLPNYLAGSILADTSPALAGRASVEERMRAGAGVTPLAIDPPETHSILYRSPAVTFGKSREILCPHYVEALGQCSIWSHRNATCATWLCKHDRGVVGFRFWANLRRLLATAELQLARWCLLEAGIGEAALAALYPLEPGKNSAGIPQPVGLPDARRRRAFWGPWWGREGEFYQECARLVAGLTWSDIRRICGVELHLEEALVRVARRDIQDDRLPERLAVSRFEVARMDRGRCLIVTYSSYDPMEISQELLRVLGYFDGGPTAEALSALAEEEGIRLDPELIRRLLDHGILVPAVEDEGVNG